LIVVTPHRSDRRWNPNRGNILGHDRKKFVCVGTNLYKLSENLPVNYDPFAMIRADAHADPRQLLVERFIALMLVPQTALEATATAGNLSGIERGLLQLGHAHGDGPQGLEKHFAANFATACFIVREQPSFVPSPDLPHFNSGAIFLGEVFDHRPKIHSIDGGEVEDDPLSTECRFALNDLQHQPRAGGYALTKRPAGAVVLLNVGILGEVGASGFADDATGIEDE